MAICVLASIFVREATDALKAVLIILIALKALISVIGVAATET